MVDTGVFYQALRMPEAQRSAFIRALSSLSPEGLGSSELPMVTDSQGREANVVYAENFVFFCSIDHAEKTIFVNDYLTLS